MGYAGKFSNLEGCRPLINHMKPERFNFRVSLTEAPELKKGPGADGTARGVLEEQETVSSQKQFKFSVYGKLSEGHQQALE